MMTTATTAAPAGTAGTDLASLHRDHYRSLVRLASLLVEDLGTCEELVQDAFVAVLSRSAAVREPARAPAYLRSAVLNGARSHLRRGAVRRRPRPSEAVEEQRSPESSTLVADEHAAVLAALRSLPDRQREVLALRYYLDLTEAEIAATLGIAPGTVKTHAQRGLAALHVALEDRR
jgi:RNA polymerase sigma-70 factor (sigma-E family)